MLLKRADDKEPQLKILRNLLAHKNIPPHKKQGIEIELRNLQIGINTEKQAAYEIDFYFGSSKNISVIHDLRLKINGRVAQIDHLLINRGLEVYALETKTFNSGLTINDRGEFATMIAGKMTGISSPVEQNARHVAVLKDAFKAIGLPKRLGMPMSPTFHPVVLVSPKAIIDRSASGEADATVIKLDQFFSWYMKKTDTLVAGDFATFLKIVSGNTVKGLGERLCELHEPARVDYVRKFAVAEDLISAAPLRPANNKDVTGDVLAKAGLMAKTFSVCTRCNASISDAVAKYCRANKKRFSEKAYCMACQGAFNP